MRTGEVEAMFDVPEGHTAKVIIGGGTNFENFNATWHALIPEKILKDMNENATRANLPFSPVLILLAEGADGHIDASISLPLQKWAEGLSVEPSIYETNDLRRITDWCAGFLHSFCATGSVNSRDLITNQLDIGKETGVFDMESAITASAPKREARILESIGDVDEILGQLDTKGIEEMKRLPVKDESPEEVPVSIEKPQDKLRQTQQNIVEKYGFKALQDMLSRTKQPLLIDEPKV